MKFEVDGEKLLIKEINAKKDFESFYKNLKIKKVYFYQKSWFWTSNGFASILIIFGFLFFNTNGNLKVYHKFINQPHNHSLVYALDNKLNTDELEFFKAKNNNVYVFRNKNENVTRTTDYYVSNSNIKTIKLKLTAYSKMSSQIISAIPVIYRLTELKHIFYSTRIFVDNKSLEESVIPNNNKKPIKIQSEYFSKKCDFYRSNEKKEKWYQERQYILEKTARNQSKTKFSKIKKSSTIIPDNLVNAELQKVPEYIKRNKKRIKIKQETAILK